MQGLTKREEILFHALRIVCKMLRDNPMGDLSSYPAELFKCLIGGMDRDPEGKEYFDYFYKKAKEIVESEEENNVKS